MDNGEMSWKNRKVNSYWVGTSGWIYLHWRGYFYPETLPPSQWFEYYAKIFPTVEINATFYRSFKESTYRKWKEKAPEGFLYVLKAPRVITHRKKLIRVESDILRFWECASLLGEKLGLVLLQLAPSTAYDPDRLYHALRVFPEPNYVAVEFRHSRWYTETVRQILEETKAVFCSVDSPESEPFDWVTSSNGYIRLHGRRFWYADNYSRKELESIAQLAQNMKEKGAKKVYIFFNNDFRAYAVKNAKTLLEMLYSSPE